MPRRPDPWSIKQRRGFWYYKLAGDTSYRSTGIEVGNWKRTQPLAERYAQERAGVGPTSRHHETLTDYAAPYFLPESCPWFAREHGRGNHVQESYRDQHRARLEIHILPAFGRVKLEDLSPVAIERWLYNLDYAGQTKLHILTAFRIVLHDLRRDRLVSFPPSDITTPVVRHKEREIPTDTEAAALFPADTDDFSTLWGGRVAMGVMLALAYSSGLRASELRALQWRAIKTDPGGLVVVQTINRDDNPAPPKARSVRAVPLPRWTLDLVEWYRTRPRSTRVEWRGKPEGDAYLFPGRNREGPGHLEIGAGRRAMTLVMEALGIDRKITPHGLRHGYNTRMRSILAGAGMDPYFDTVNGFRMTTTATDAVLRAFTGHRTQAMTDLYDHPELEGQLRFFDQHFRRLVDGYWDFRETTDMEGNGHGEE